MKKSFFLMIFLSFYFLSQSVQAAPYDYLCDSRPNDPLSLCSTECAPKCDYTYLVNSQAECSTACPAGTILVDCPYVEMWHANCIKLQCGDAGVPSGNTCIQDPSLDSSCLDSSNHRYGWSDNTAPLSCNCYPTIVSDVERIMKKVDGTACSKTGVPSGTCQSGKCTPNPIPPTDCPDGTHKGSCCSQYPGTICKDDGASGIRCVADTTCPTCIDSDNGINTAVVGTCKDTAGGLCDTSTGGCTDTCASNGAVYEYYCAGPSAQSCMKKTVACPGSEFCYGGVCSSGPSDPYNPAPTPGGCAWYSSTFGICSSGCPPSYYDAEQVCCETNSKVDCRGAPACASYNPTIGETPCCTATGYQTCKKEEQCTPTGCQKVCNLDDKTSDLYCEKCDSCRDGVQNCGECAINVNGKDCE